MSPTDYRKFDPAKSSNPYINGEKVHTFSWDAPLCIRCGTLGHLPWACEGKEVSAPERRHLTDLVNEARKRSDQDRPRKRRYSERSPESPHHQRSTSPNEFFSRRGQHNSVSTNRRHEIAERVAGRLAAVYDHSPSQMVLINGRYTHQAIRSDKNKGGPTEASSLNSVNSKQGGNVPQAELDVAEVERKAELRRQAQVKLDAWKKKYGFEVEEKKGKVEGNTGEVEEKNDAVEKKQDEVEGTTGEVKTRQGEVEEKSDEVNEKSDKVNEKNNEVNEKSNEVNEENNEVNAKEDELNEKEDEVEEDNKVQEKEDQAQEQEESGGTSEDVPNAEIQLHPIGVQTDTSTSPLVAPTAEQPTAPAITFSLAMGATKRFSNGEGKVIGPPTSTIRVAAAFVSQSTIEKKLQVSSTDAQERGLAEAREDSARLQGVIWLDSTRRALQLPVRTFTTACVYYHKFRLAHQNFEYNWADAAAASLLTACKNEDTLKKSRDILAAAYNVKQAPGIEQIGADDPIFESPSKVVIGLERLVLESGGFDFRTRSPHQAMMKISKSLPPCEDSKQVSELGWTVLTDLHRTFAPLKQTSFTLALASLELASHLTAATSENGKSEMLDVMQTFDWAVWASSREEVMETLLDALDLYTHHTSSSILGTKYSLDDLLRIRLAFNKECSDSNLPRYTSRAPPPSPDDVQSSGNTLRVSNGHPTPVSPPQPGVHPPQQAGGVNPPVAAPEPGDTLRFMLDPQRSVNEKSEVAKYYTEEWEEYEEEVEIPIQHNESRDRDRERDRSRVERPRDYPSDRSDRDRDRRPRDFDDRRSANTDRDYERDRLRDRDREADRDRARMRDRDRDQRYDDRRYNERDRRYDDRRDRDRERDRDRDRDRRYR